MNLNELRQRRGEVIAQMRAVLDASGNEDLSAQDQERYDKLDKEQHALKEQIEGEERRVAAQAERLQRQADLDAEMARSQGTRGARREQPGNEDRRGGERETFTVRGVRFERNPEARAALNKFVRGGLQAMSQAEMRALQAENDIQGGYLRPDQEFVAQLIQFVDNAVYIRQEATHMFLPTADSIGVPSLDTDPADSDWTSELATGNADTAMAFGRREMRPHPLAKRILVSNKLLRQTGNLGAVDAEALVRERLAYKFGVTQEKAFLTGTGSQQPLGLFTASANGISTARDVNTSNTTTAVVADNLVSVKYTLKPQYRNGGRAKWLFNRTVLATIAKLKDGDGQYLWQPGLQAGQPDRLLNLPVLESEYAPNTMTTGQYVGLLGDLSFYWIVDSLEFQLQRLIELYAATNQTGFIGRLETDGMPVLEEAFVRVTLA